MSNPINAIDDVKKLLNEVVDVLKLADNEILQISKSARKASSDFLSIKSPKELNEQLKTSRELQENLTKAYEDQKTKVSSLQKQIDALKRARTGSGKSANEEEKQQKRLDRSITKLNQTYSETEKQIIKNNAQAAQNRRNIRVEESLYGKISIKLKKTAAEYKELSLKKQIFNDISKKEERRMALLEKRIDKYRGALVKADERTGNFSRSVGDYSGRFDTLGNSINQLTREMPAFSVSAQTGFLAISNNIPTLVDEINRLRSTNKALASEGKPTKSILTQLGAAMFSWQTAISIGITLLTVYGKDLVELAFGANEASKQQQRLNEAVAQGNADSINASASLKTLLSIVKDNTASEKAREGALKSLSETVVELEGVELSQAGAMEKIISLSEKYILATEARAKADAFASLSAEIEAEIIKRKAKDLEEEAKWYDKLVAGILDYTSKGVGSAFLTSQASKNRAKGLKEEGDFLEQVNDKMREYLEKALELESGLKGFDDKSNKKTKEKNKFLKNSIGYYEDIIRKLKEQQINTSKNTKDFAEFEHQIQVIRNIIRNLKGDFEQLEEISLADAFKFFDDEEELSREIELLKELINIKIKDANGDIDPIKVLIDTAEGVEDLENLYKQLTELDKEYKENRTQLQSELNSELKGFSQALTDSLFELESQKYDERIERNNNFYDALLNNEELSDEQRQAYQKARDQENERLEKERAEVQRRAFLVNQAVKLTEIVIDTAQKVSAIKAQAALLSSNPATAAFAGVALAQIPLVIATGAVAGATIAAQTIPAFKDGKPESNNYSGDAIVGDGNKREVIYNPNTGYFGITPDKPTLTTVKSDDIVYSSIPNAIEGIGQAAIMTSLYSNNLNAKDSSHVLDYLLKKYSNEMSGGVEKALDRGFKRMNINNNIYVQSNSWGDNHINSKYKD